MDRLDKARIVEAHEPHWPTIWIWIGFLAAFVAAEGLLAWSLINGPLWLIAMLTIIVAHLMHAHILAFHETSHGTLCPGKFWNEIIGLFIGSLSFQGLTAFRAVHSAHHRHLGTERDEELWPFVVSSVPRWARRLIALYELTLGITYTPLLCVRTFCRSESPISDRGARRRAANEYMLMAVVWAVILGLVAYWAAWKFLVVLYVIPGVLAGNMHSLRKYIEHMGLMSSTILGSTRSIVPASFWGRFVAFSLFNITYHGVHHRYAKIPQARLPELTSLLRAPGDDEPAPFSSYWAAFCEMWRSLSDPRVGAQWRETRSADVTEKQTLAA